MTILSDLPELIPLLEKVQSAFSEFDSDETATFENTQKITLLMQDNKELFDKIDEHISTFQLSGKFRTELVASVENDIADPTVRRISISVGHFIPFNPRLDQDWIERDDFNESGILDRWVSYNLLSTELIELAQETWNGIEKVEVAKPAPEDGYYSDSVSILDAHGLPSDSSTWGWAAEALSYAQEGLVLMGFDYKLCDYVEWTCTGEPPNMYLGSDFSEPLFVEASGFGVRLIEEEKQKRIQGCVIWKKEDGSYISPLWEYLAWASQTFGEFKEHAIHLGAIGEGIDSAAIMHDPDFDPIDKHRIRLTADDIFRAGSALIKLRIKMELEDVTLTGFQAKKTEKLRAEKTGERSREARNRRIRDLLKNMERIASDNPAFRRLDDVTLASLAAQDGATANPKLWAQGKGQVSEYLGEIRRGEAGTDFQTRYRALFPSA